jgi:hypothetical protein
MPKLAPTLVTMPAIAEGQVVMQMTAPRITETIAVADRILLEQSTNHGFPQVSYLTPIPVGSGRWGSSAFPSRRHFPGSARLHARPSANYEPFEAANVIRE